MPKILCYMKKFKELAERIRCAMAGRPHKVLVDENERCICVTGINVPMLADLREIAVKFGAEVYPNNSWDFVEIEL